MEIRKALLLILIVAAVSVPCVFASPIDPMNNRPMVVQPNYPGEPGLQSIVDGVLKPAGSINVDTDQINAGMFGMATGAPSTIPTIVAEWTNNSAIQKFGIWFGNDTSNIFKVDIFSGSDSPYDPSNSHTVSSASLIFYPGELKIVKEGTATQYITNPLVNSGAFGFYLNTGSDYYYTLDALNPQGEARALAFGLATNFVIAFEDGTDFDYQDMVVKVESIQPVPEPGTLVFLGTGLVGLSAMIYRRRNNR